MGGYDHTSTERSRRRRARLKVERLAAEKAAKIAHRAELDARRAAKGLPTAKTSTERARESRERHAVAKEAIRMESWFSPPFRDWYEAKAYLTGLKPDVPVQIIENTLETTRRESQKWQLHWNRFLVTQCAMTARIRRAVVWQCLEHYGGDLDRLPQAMQDAESQSDIKTTLDAHPTQARQERQHALDLSQVMLTQGNLLNCAA